MPLFDVHPQTGASIEVFYADRTMETFGRCGVGWFWCWRRRGFRAGGPAAGPFPTRYSAYRDAMSATGFGGQLGHNRRDENHNITRRPLLEQALSIPSLNM